MPGRFFGIEWGREISLPGMRVVAAEDGEKIYMHGKWLELGDDHIVVVSIGAPVFKRADGKILRAGQFPAWVVRGRKPTPSSGMPMAMMLNATQFSGGSVSFTSAAGKTIVASL